jgi:hypothetical protein
MLASVSSAALYPTFASRYKYTPEMPRGFMDPKRDGIRRHSGSLPPEGLLFCRMKRAAQKIGYLRPAWKQNSKKHP